jgi:DNA-binding MarR family transcriptional regulator
MKNNKRRLNLADLLLLFRRDIIERFRQEGLKQDLKFSQMEVLNFIGPTEMKTMRDIADYLKITPPSATTIVAEMEEKGLIKRKDDKKDRRIVYVAFTDTAKKLFVSWNKHKEVILKKMTKKLNKKDYTSLERIIRIIINK